MLLWIDGFDHYGNNTDTLVTLGAGAYLDRTASHTMSTAQSVTGGMSLQNAGDFGNPGLGIPVPAGNNTIGIGFHMRLSAVGAVTLLGMSDLVASMCEIDVVSGELRLKHGGNSDIATSTTAFLSADTWYHFEMLLTLANGTSGACEIRINGVPVLEVANVDTIDSGVNLTKIRWWWPSNSTSAYFDNLYLWNPAGSTNNTFLGPSFVYTQLPSADGPEQDWTPLGVAWEDISDVPSGTTYIESTGFGDRSSFEIAQLPSQNIAIKGVQFSARHQASTAVACQFKIGALAGVDEQQSVDLFPVDGVWVWGAFIAENNPATTSTWTPSGLEAALITLEQT